MIRRIIIVILLLGCIGTVASWAASYALVNKSFERYGIKESGFTVEKPFQGGNLGAVVSKGTVSVLLTTALAPDQAVTETYHRFLGFEIHAFAQIFQPEGRYLIRSLHLPLWSLLLLLAAYPAIVFIRGPYRRYRRRRKGLCIKCGYNLTGNVSGTCPECAVKI